MKKRIALAGNPNCGKTSLFNELTGSNQYVGNWPGVTVEHKVGTLKDSPEIQIIDLPGIYSLSPYTPEEIVSRNYLLEQSPDVILNVVDATNIERNLYLSSQLIETGLPIIIALNMMDLVALRGDQIDTVALSAELGCPVVEVSALKKTGLDKLNDLLEAAPPVPAPAIKMHDALEDAITAIQTRLGCKRLQAVKLLESDHEMLKTLGQSGEDHIFIEQQCNDLEKQADDDIASIIAGGRYDAITAMMARCLKKVEMKASFSQKLDAVLTHRVLGLGIFAAIMWCIYWVSISTVGDWGTAWANDVLFGPVIGGWLGGFIGDAAAPMESLLMLSAVLSMCLVFPATLRRLHDLGFNGSWLYLAIAPFLLEYMCPHMPEALHTGVMYALYGANALILLACLLMPGKKGANNFGKEARFKKSIFSLTGRAGRVEYVVLFLIMSALSISIALLGKLGLDCSEQVQSLCGDGIVGGVGAVLGFLPQMAVLFLLLSLLEDCGYMARVAFMMDRIFRTIGLSGKSFIPLLVSMGCGVPGVMATRTIENEKDRRMTIMLTCFMPCGAKLPIIALFAAMIGADANIATIAYFSSISSVILCGLMLRKTKLFAGGYTPFVMELPAYHMPAGANINLRAMERCKAFVQKAGTVIFLASALIWFMQSYNWKMEYLGGEVEEESILADTGNLVAPAFTPLGWGEWKPAVATVTGLLAKEQVLATFGVLYPATEVEEEEEEEELDASPTLPKTNALTALSMLAWQLSGALECCDAEETGEAEAAQALASTEAADAAGDEEELDEEEQEAMEIASRLTAAGAFTTLSALSFMLFNLLCAPCFAACGAIRREMNSGAWTWFAILFMCAWAYATAFLVYQLGLWITQGIFGSGQAAACVLCVILIFLLFRKTPQSK